MYFVGYQSWREIKDIYLVQWFSIGVDFVFLGTFGHV